MIQPGPRIGRVDGLEAEQVLDRALEADRRRVQGAHRRNLPSSQSSVAIAISRLAASSSAIWTMPTSPTGPRASTGRRRVGARDRARDRDRPDGAAMVGFHARGARRTGFRSASAWSPISEADWPRAGTRRPAAAADRRRPSAPIQMRDDGQVGGAARRRAAGRLAERHA